MKISSLNLNLPESSDDASIKEISDNFQLLDNIYGSILGLPFGGFIENDSVTVLQGKVYLEKKSNKLWRILTNGVFKDVDKKVFSLEEMTHKTTSILNGEGITGGGSLDRDRTLHLTKATSNVLGGIRLGQGLKMQDNGRVDALPPIGALLFLTQNDNPNTIFLGTTWEKIEGRYLKGTSSSQNAGILGGNNSVTLSESNLPRHTHSASSSAHSHSIGQSNHTHVATQGRHNHTQGEHYHATWGENSNNSPFGIYNYNKHHWGSHGGIDGDNALYKTSSNSAGAISYVQPRITVNSSRVNVTLGSTTPNVTVNHSGNGNAFNIEPRYYTCHIWKRLT